MIEPKHFFDLMPFTYRDVFEGVHRVWETLERIGPFVETQIRERRESGLPLIEGDIHPGAEIDESQVIVEEGAKVEHSAYIQGPALIGAGTTVRHGAYVRKNCLVGKNCVVGHSTELKNCVLLDGAKAPHFNYVGDSLLGARVNLGAGTKISNVKITPDSIKVSVAGTLYDTGLRKFGAVLGDEVQTGCNAVLNPGTLIGPRSLVYPGALCWGYHERKSLIKVRRECFASGKLRAGQLEQT